MREIEDTHLYSCSRILEIKILGANLKHEERKTYSKGRILLHGGTGGESTESTSSLIRGICHVVILSLQYPR